MSAEIRASLEGTLKLGRKIYIYIYIYLLCQDHFRKHPSLWPKIKNIFKNL